MTFSRSVRVRLIGMLSVVILFAQVAVAGYVCPALSGTAGSVSPHMAGMPCAQMMAADVELDPDQPTLCMNHCQFGSTSQSVDLVPPVFAPSTALPAMLSVPVDDRRESVLSSWAEDERLRDRPSPIPHSIAHCCYRI